MEELTQETIEFRKWLFEETETKVEYTPIEYVLSENEVFLCETLNENLPQLAPYVDFLISARLGRVSTLLIAPRQGGKTKSIILSTQILPAERIDGLDKLTLAKKLSTYEGKEVDTYVEDMTNIVDTQTLPIIATLIFQHTYDTAQLKIPQIDLCFFGGCHHEKLAQLVNLPEWNQMLQDRLVRLYILYFDRSSPLRVLRDDEFPEIPKLEINHNQPQFEVTDEEISELVPILESQISTERAFNFIKSILKGHAMFCQRESVTQEDIDWFKLYDPILGLEQFLYRRIPKSEKMIFDEFAFGVLHEYLKNFREPDRIARRMRITQEALKNTLERVLGTLQVSFKLGEPPTGIWIEKLKNLFNVFDLEPISEEPD